MQKTRITVASNLLIFAIVFIVICSVFLTTEIGTKSNQSDIAFAAVGDSETVTFYAEPYDSNQRCVWTLEYDSDKTSSIVYNVVKDQAISKYLTMETTDNTCTLTCNAYAKLIITYKVYFILTATSVENPELSTTCSICVGG